MQSSWRLPAFDKATLTRRQLRDILPIFRNRVPLARTKAGALKRDEVRLNRPGGKFAAPLPLRERDHRVLRDAIQPNLMMLYFYWVTNAKVWLGCVTDGGCPKRR